MSAAEIVPIVMAVLGCLTALFQWLGKRKAVKMTKVMVDAVESFGDPALKKSIAFASDVNGVGDALSAVVKKITK